MDLIILIVTSYLLTFCVENVSAGCFHDPSEVIIMCSQETKVGESLFVNADFTVAGHDRCSCTISQTLEGEMSIFYVVGSVFPMCRNEVNFYMEETPIYNLNCLTTQSYSGNVKSYTAVTFNVTGEGNMDVCIAVQAVSGSLLTMTCDDKIQVPTTTEPTTTITSSTLGDTTKVTSEGQEVNSTKTGPKSAGSQAAASASFPTATVASVITVIVVTAIVAGVVVYIKMSRPRRTGPSSKC